MILMLKNRNLECIQNIYGDKADRFYVCGVWLMAVLEVANIFFALQSANPQRKFNSFAPHPQV